MDIDFVEKLIGLVARSPVSELEIERDGIHVRIAKQTTPAAAAAVPVDLGSTAPAIARHSIRAALTGTFYRSAAQGDPPLVAVGDVVEEGQKLGVLEAMKTFNVVEADRAGRIVQISCEDRFTVQAGDVLFVLEEVG